MKDIGVEMPKNMPKTLCEKIDEVKNWEEGEEFVDCLRCSVLLSEGLICPQCGLDNKPKHE